MKAFVELKKGGAGYLWHGACEIGTFAIIKTSNGELKAGVIGSFTYHGFTGRD